MDVIYIDRDRSTQMILNRLQKELDNKYSLEILRSIAKNLEIGIYNNVLSKNNIDINKTYIRRFSNVCWNIDHNNNPYFLDKILSKEWSFEYIAGLKSDNLYIEEKTRLINEMKKKIKESHDAEKEARKNQTGMFKCGKCKTYKTEHVEIFSRSADEPPVIKVKCLNCDNAWKFS